MMEGNNDIFLASDDSLGYLANDRFFYPSHIPSWAHMYAFRIPPLFVYVILSI